MKDVEIVEVGGDAGLPGSGTGFARDRRTTPRVTPRPVRPAAAAVVLLVAALLAVAAFGQWRSHRRSVVTVHSVPAAAPTAVDALGCPVRSSCTVSIVAVPAQLNAVSHWNSDAQIDSSVVVYDDDDVAVHGLLVLELGRARTLVTITYQCIPGGAAVTGSLRTGRGITSVTVSGRTGCSVVVTGALDAGALTRLARERGLQL